ncbi:putative acetyltransferase [compost metagenome]
MDFSIRKANVNELDAVFSVYANAIVTMNENNIPQWDEVYPSKQDIMEDINEEQLYLVESDLNIVSVFVLNQDFDEEYELGKWQYPDASFCVIHRLCVNPLFQNKGMGSSTMLLIEDLVKQMGLETIRLDAFSQNPYALRMYEKLHYRTVGEVQWRKGLFYLMEKKLN